MAYVSRMAGIKDRDLWAFVLSDWERSPSQQRVATSPQSGMIFNCVVTARHRSFRQKIFRSCSQMLEVVASIGFKIIVFLLADVRLIFFPTAARFAGRHEEAKMKIGASCCHSGFAKCLLVAKNGFSTARETL